MGPFKSSRIFYLAAPLIDNVAKDIVNSFEEEGYEVISNRLLSGGYDISITKGNVFKALLGMRSALKVILRQEGQDIYMEAGIGIFGQQAVPTAITALVAWPVIIAQVWGMVQQSKLDDKAMEIAEKSLYSNRYSKDAPNSGHEKQPIKYCPQCGCQARVDAKFCVECGQRL